MPIDINAEIEAQRAKAADANRDLKADKTKKEYDSAQEEFREWCREKIQRGDAQFMVDKRKFYLFLTDMHDETYYIKRKYGILEKRILKVRPKAFPSKGCNYVIGILEGSEEDAEEDLLDHTQDKRKTCFDVLPLEDQQKISGVNLVKKYNSITDEDSLTTYLAAHANEEFIETTVEKIKFFGRRDDLLAFFKVNIKFNTCSHKQLEGFSSAIKDLYCSQTPDRSVEEICTPDVKNLLSRARKADNERMETIGGDRQIGSVKDGYMGKTDLEKCCSYLFNQRSLSGVKWLLGFVFCHFCLLRGQMFRSLNLSD